MMKECEALCSEA